MKTDIKFLVSFVVHIFCWYLFIERGSSDEPWTEEALMMQFGVVAVGIVTFFMMMFYATASTVKSFKDNIKD